MVSRTGAPNVPAADPKRTSTAVGTVGTTPTVEHVITTSSEWEQLCAVMYEQPSRLDSVPTQLTSSMRIGSVPGNVPAGLTMKAPTSE